MVKEKKLSIFHGFCPPPRISSSHLFFLAFYFPITTSTPPFHHHLHCRPGASIFSDPHTSVSFAPLCYIYTHGRWLMMSIFHLSVCANFCFSQQFTLDSPLDRTCKNEIIIIVLRGVYRLIYARVYNIIYIFHLLKRMDMWFKESVT